MNHSKRILRRVFFVAASLFLGDVFNPCKCKRNTIWQLAAKAAQLYALTISLYHFIISPGHQYLVLQSLQRRHIGLQTSIFYCRNTNAKTISRALLCKVPKIYLTEIVKNGSR